MNITAAILIIASAAPPYTPLNTVATASRKAETPLPLMSAGGITEMIASIGQAVQQDRGDAGPQHGDGDVLLGVLHLVAGGIGQLEADVVEEQQRRQRDELQSTWG